MRTKHSRLRRFPKRGSFDRNDIDAILDEALIANVGFVYEDRPAVIATLLARADDEVLVHGSSASRLVKAVRSGDGLDVCISATIVSGIVMARSALQHSVNYRSVVLYGRLQEIKGSAERLAALETFMEEVIPGRWESVRPPSPKEAKATGILSMPITEGAAKVRSGDPDDLEEDAELAGWGGVLPLHTVAGPPLTDPRLPEPERPVPDHVIRLAERFNGRASGR